MTLKLFLKSVIGKTLMDMTHYAYKFGYVSFHKKVLSIFGVSCLPIENYESYLAKYDRVETWLIEKNRYGVSYPVNDTIENKIPGIVEFDLPNLHCHHLKDVIITGDSDCVVDLNSGCLINNMCYNVEGNITLIDGLLYRHMENHCTVRSNFKKEPIRIKEGIMISGKFSANYYHELYENLNRLLLIDLYSLPEDVPLLVDEVVFKIPSLEKIFTILSANSKRTIVKLKPRQLYLIDSLYTFDHINDLAPHINRLQAGSNYFRYDKEYTAKERDLLLAHKSDIDSPKRIFLTRANTSHRHFNEDEIFDILSHFGFERVATEKYSFEDQVALFNNAEWVIGCTGAAFSNVLFCNEQCKIICFRSSNLGKEPPIFNTIAQMFGARFWYYAPDWTKSKTSVHSDFYVDPKRFFEVFSTLV